MALFVLIFGVAFAAFCVWLTVRIVNRRERWAKWTLACVVGLPVLYVASFGPACWISSRMRFGNHAVSVAYQPFLRAWWNHKQPEKAIRWYAKMAAPDDWDVLRRLPTDYCHWNSTNDLIP